MLNIDTTVDIAAHEILEDGKVRELHCETGHAMTETRVIDGFIADLKAVFSERFIDEYKLQNPPDWFDIVQEIKSKMHLVSESRKNPISFRLPHSFDVEYANMKQQMVEAAISNSNTRGISFKQGRVQFSADLSRTKFTDVVERIISHVRQLLLKPELQGVKYLFMVGSFSGCPMLGDAMVKQFSPRFKVMIPEAPMLSAIKGAVLFGHQIELSKVRK